MSAKIKKREAIKSLEALTHWLYNSDFDYSYEDFKLLIDDIDLSYKCYLFEIKKAKQLKEIRDERNG